MTTNGRRSDGAAAPLARASRRSHSSGATRSNFGRHLPGRGARRVSRAGDHLAPRAPAGEAVTRDPGLGESHLPAAFRAAPNARASSPPTRRGTQRSNSPRADICVSSCLELAAELDAGDLLGPPTWARSGRSPFRRAPSPHRRPASPPVGRTCVGASIFRPPRPPHGTMDTTAASASRCPSERCGELRSRHERSSPLRHSRTDAATPSFGR